MGWDPGWGVNEWVAVASAALAVISLLFNFAVVRRQTALQFETLKAEMDAEVVAWASEAIDAVSQAIGLARGRGAIYPAGDFRRLAAEASERLSALADRGRLFFPNEAPQGHGVEKESAFQGFRQPIIDAMIFACAQMGRIDPVASGPDDAAADYLLKCRRLLVSEAQNAVDPRRRKQMLRRLRVGRADDERSAFTVADELSEALEKRYPGVLDLRRDPDWIARRNQMLKKR